MEFPLISLTYGDLDGIDGNVSPEISRRLEEIGEYRSLLVGDDAAAFTRVLNQGIDSHLEAWTSPVTWQAHKLRGDGSAQDMRVLLRRLVEDGQDDALNLASLILSTLQVEWI